MPKAVAHFSLDDEAADDSPATPPRAADNMTASIGEKAGRTKEGEGSSSETSSAARQVSPRPADAAALPAKPRWQTLPVLSLPWVSAHLTNPQDWKTVFRCSLAACARLLAQRSRSKSIPQLAWVCNHGDWTRSQQPRQRLLSPPHRRLHLPTQRSYYDHDRAATVHDHLDRPQCSSRVY